MAIARPKENPTIGMSGTGTKIMGPTPKPAPKPKPDTTKAEDK